MAWVRGIPADVAHVTCPWVLTGPIRRRELSGGVIVEGLDLVSDFVLILPLMYEKGLDCMLSISVNWPLSVTSDPRPNPESMLMHVCPLLGGALSAEGAEHVPLVFERENPMDTLLHDDDGSLGSFLIELSGYWLS